MYFKIYLQNVFFKNVFKNSYQRAGTFIVKLKILKNW